jgi:hypothetical protein
MKKNRPSKSDKNGFSFAEDAKKEQKEPVG